MLVKFRCNQQQLTRPCSEPFALIRYHEFVFFDTFDAYITFSSFIGNMIRYKLAEQLELKRYREGRRIALLELSEKTGINRSTISKILNQRGYVTTTETLDKLCEFFECGVSDIIERLPDSILHRQHPTENEDSR
jgi:putative transcriptional regulator